MTAVKKEAKKRHPRGMEGPIIQSLRTLFRGVGPFAPNMMGALAYKLWFTPRRFRRPSWEHSLAATAESTYWVEVERGRVPVWAWSEGPTILLVHGWEGRGTQLGSFVTPLTSLGFRVVCFDAPAHGSTEGKTTDAVEMQIIIDKIAAREGGLYAVISHSFGAVPTSFALRKGLELDRLVLISPPSEIGAMLEIFQNDLAIPDKVLASLKKRIEARFPDHGKRLWDEFSIHSSARLFTMPGLVIHDREDAVIPISQGRLIADAWQQVEQMETQGLGHRKILQDAAVIGRVAAFLGTPVQRTSALEC